MEYQSKRFDLDTISTPNLTVREEIELDKHAVRLKGILLTADREDLLYHRGTLSLSVGGEEVFSEDYHARLLMSGLGVAPEDRFLPLDLRLGNGVVKVGFKDADHPTIAHQPYNVSVYLKLRYDDEIE
jgi:hypothetical protein